jgi:VIT family
VTWKSVVKRVLIVAVPGAAIYIVLPRLIAVLGAWPRLSALNQVWFTVCLRDRRLLAAAPSSVGYTSAVSDRDYYAAESAREEAEISSTPETERQEIRDIYAAKGFSGDLPEGVVDTITANRDA